MAPGVAVLALVVTGSSACGQKGDPLPPLVRMPSAPAAFTAARRAGVVDVSFTVPAANADGTRPANIERIDVYALTGASTIADEQVIRLGTRIASLPVKAPRDPDDVVEPNDTDDDLAPLVGSGLDQGATAHVREDLSTIQPGTASAEGGALIVRHYIGVSITTRGRRGLFSKRVAVPLGTPPDSPSKPQVRYDEESMTVTWTSATSSPGPLTTYHVYSSNGSIQGQTETRLTTAPLARTEFVEARVEWGTERCYAVSSVAARDGLSVEGEASPPTCVTPVDTFAPRAPVGLTAVGSDAVINLSWDANAEADLSGYVILRGTTAGALVPITPVPVTDTTFRDVVPDAARYAYAVRAVDTSGNAGPASGTVEATAR